MNLLIFCRIINFDFGGDGTQNENFKRRCAQKFAKQVLGNLYDFDSRIVIQTFCSPHN